MNIREMGYIKITKHYRPISVNFGSTSERHDTFWLEYEWIDGEVIGISLPLINELFGYDFEGISLYDPKIEDTLYSLHKIGPYRIRFLEYDYVKNVLYATRYSLKGEVIHYWLRFRIAFYWKYMYFLYWLSLKGLAEYKPPGKQSWRSIPILQKTIGNIWKEKTEEKIHQELLEELKKTGWKIRSEDNSPK